MKIVIVMTVDMEPFIDEKIELKNRKDAMRLSERIDSAIQLFCDEMDIDRD